MAKVCSLGGFHDFDQIVIYKHEDRSISFSFQSKISKGQNLNNLLIILQIVKKNIHSFFNWISTCLGYLIQKPYL